MIGIGIAGANYGRSVLVPAFRRDPRCEIVALAGSDAERAAEFARSANIPRAFGGWQALVEESSVAVVAIAVPPHLQPAIAQRVLELGKPVFLEKPLAADLAGARMIFESARKSGRPTIIDFNFPELPSWRQGAVGGRGDRASAERRRDLEFRKSCHAFASQELEDARRRRRRSVGKFRVSLLL
jgi:predicted dehydrogenase